MVPVTFDDLNEYTTIEVLKYLTLLERFKYERINWKFQTCFTTLWNSQKAIALSGKSFHESELYFWVLTEPNCSHKDHQLSAKDICLLEKPLDREYGIKMLNKCPNLLALYLESPDANFFKELKHLTKLEHVFMMELP